ncbi:MAG TPA: hypothetical protein VFC01_31285, partial [Mycobacterium sp.]|nr:hypothetical protein [Mycobacterium sp.]
MFETLKLIVDAIRGALPALTKARKEKRLAQVGAALFLLYVKGNEIVATGYRIVDFLENYVDRVQNGNAYTKAHAGRWISSTLQPLLRGQYHDLRDLDIAMGKLQIELQI